MGALQGLVTVDHEEVDGSPVELFTERGFEARRILECAFSDRLKLSQELLGGTRLVGEVYVYTSPQTYPHYSSAVARDVRIEPFGGTVSGTSSTELEYELARLHVTYAIPDHTLGQEGEVLISESLEPAVEFLTLPHEKFYWDDQGTEPLNASEAPARIVRMIDWIYTRYKMVEIPPATLGLVGKVNSGSLTSITFNLTFPSESLLYNPPQLEREVTTDGTVTWKVTYRFTYRSESWNKFPKRGSETMQTIYREDGGGYSIFRPYELGDFSLILG